MTSLPATSIPPISDKTQMTVPKVNFIICGLEHSGTTLISDLFREHPDCDSGFECGVLLCNSPKEFPSLSPFYQNMPSGWGISEQELARACEADSHGSFYDRIIKNSTILRAKSAPLIFDKTPRYITKLKSICETTGLPVIAAIKDPRAIAASDFKRTKQAADEIESWYANWAPRKIAYMRRAYAGYLHAWESKQCLVVRLEDLCLNTRDTFEQMFRHVGLEPRLSYLKLDHKRYSNTKGKSVDPVSCLSFTTVIPEKIEARILNDFAEFTLWFYDFGIIR